jgi:hypothetical protein
MNGILNSSPPTPLPGTTQNQRPKDWQKQAQLLLQSPLAFTIPGDNSPTIHLTVSELHGDFATFIRHLDFSLIMKLLHGRSIPTVAVNPRTTTHRIRI